MLFYNSGSSKSAKLVSNFAFVKEEAKLVSSFLFKTPGKSKGTEFHDIGMRLKRDCHKNAMELP